MSERTTNSCRNLTSAVPTFLYSLVIITTVFGMAVGCRQGSSELLSETAHDADQPTRGKASFMWQAVNDEEFVELLGAFGMGDAEFLSTNHALTTRAQFWLDRLDQQLRETHPEDLANVPRPLARVVKEGSANAFVVPMPVCYRVPVTLNAALPSAGAAADLVFLDTTSGNFSAWPQEVPCKDAEDVGALREFVAAFNAGTRGCQLALVGEILEAGVECEIESDLGDVTHADGVVIFQTANRVSVHSGLFPLMSEEALVSVLAHELGHYYRAHTTRFSLEYDFFYTMTPDQQPRRPVAEPDKHELGQGAVMGSTLLNASDAYYAIEGMRLRPELYSAVGTVLAAVCKAGECDASCETAVDQVGRIEFMAAMGLYPFGQGSEAMRATYASFETQALACLETVSLVSTPATVTGSQLSWDVIRRAVLAPTWPAWLADLPDFVKPQFRRINQLVAMRIGGAPTDAATAKEALLAASRVLDAQDEASETLLMAAAAQRLGYYTAEQEADDESAEWLAELGIDPAHSVDAMRRLGRGTVTSLRGFVLGEKDCEALRSNRWRDANGNYVFVPVGDYSEVHHSICYRMFNLEREIAAHEHKQAEVPAPVLSAEAWRDLQMLATSVLEAEALDVAPNVAPDALEVHPLLRRTGVLNSCPYAYRYH